MGEFSLLGFHSFSCLDSWLVSSLKDHDSLCARDEIARDLYKQRVVSRFPCLRRSDALVKKNPEVPYELSFSIKTK